MGHLQASLFITALAAVLSAPILDDAEAAQVIHATSIVDLPVDESNRLSKQCLLIRADSLKAPVSLAANQFQARSPALQIVVLSGELADTLLPPQKRELLDDEGHDQGQEIIGCVMVGTSRSLVRAGVVVRPDDWQSLRSFIANKCEQAEVGFINHLHVPVDLKWISPHDGSLVDQAVLEPRCKISIMGTECVHWRNTQLGHKFLLRANVLHGEEIVIDVKSHGIHAIGQSDDIAYAASHRNWTRITANTAEMERRRVLAIHRTFTEVGFDTQPIPELVWAEMSAYYYNNRHEAQREDWDVLGEAAYVNWWESPTSVILMPTRLKAKWQAMMMPVISAWAGDIELEPTALYGMRVYTDGSWLNRHVDREDTHALSAIMNLDQSEDVQPWPLVIDAVDGVTHNVTITPGEMVFYESAKCLHGRPHPLVGRRFVNAFIHYRPKGKPKWYRTEGRKNAQALQWAAAHVLRRAEEAKEMALRVAANAGIHFEHEPQIRLVAAQENPHHAEDTAGSNVVAPEHKATTTQASPPKKLLSDMAAEREEMRRQREARLAEKAAAVAADVAGARATFSPPSPVAAAAEEGGGSAELALDAVLVLLAGSVIWFMLKKLGLTVAIEVRVRQALKLRTKGSSE